MCTKVACWYANLKTLQNKYGARQQTDFLRIVIQENKGAREFSLCDRVFFGFDVKGSDFQGVYMYQPTFWKHVRRETFGLVREKSRSFRKHFCENVICPVSVKWVLRDCKILWCEVLVLFNNSKGLLRNGISLKIILVFFFREKAAGALAMLDSSDKTVELSCFDLFVIHGFNQWKLTQSEARFSYGRTIFYLFSDYQKFQTVYMGIHGLWRRIHMQNSQARNCFVKLDICTIA